MADQRPEPDMQFLYKGKDLYVYTDRSHKPPYRLCYRVTWPPVGDTIPGCTVGREGLQRLKQATA